MAALDFPNAPTVGQIYVAATGVTYQWTGTLWAVYGTVPPSSGFVSPPTYDSTAANPIDLGTASTGNTPITITQGQPVFTRSFTALDPTHPIEVDATLQLGAGGAATTAYAALFIDGVATPVMQTNVTINTTWASPARVYWQGVLSAGPHTFQLRFGAAASNVILNGNNAVAAGGGALKTTMTIREVGIGIKGPTGDPGPVGGAAATPITAFDNTRGAALASIPADDTIPQITEGTRAWLRTFTAVNAANSIEVDADIDFGASSAAAHAGVALFIDGATDAVSSRMTTCNANWFSMVRLRWRGVLAAGPHTFEIRVGGVASPVYLNRADGLFLGGTIQSCVSITEIATPAATGIQGPPGPAGPIGGYQTGDTITSYRTTASSGWVVADDGTIGDATSGATTRANADCIDLFNLFWPNANCLIAGGKGASAAADWAAHKALGLPKTLGRVLGVAGAAGTGTTARGVGDAVGEETHTQSVAEMPVHAHTLPNVLLSQPLASFIAGSSVGGAGTTTGNAGSGTPFNVMQPSAFLKLHIKL